MDNKSLSSYDVYGMVMQIKQDHERKEMTLKVVLSALKHMEETGEKVDIKGLIKDIEKVIKPAKEG